MRSPSTTTTALSTGGLPLQSISRPPSSRVAKRLLRVDLAVEAARETSHVAQPEAPLFAIFLTVRGHSGLLGFVERFLVSVLIDRQVEARIAIESAIAADVHHVGNRLQEMGHILRFEPGVELGFPGLAQ